MITNNNKIVNIPNSITIIRIFLLAIALLMFGSSADVTNNFKIATALFCFASFTDFLDGYFARKLNQVTTFGKILDPTVDRLVFIFGTLKLLQLELIPVPIASFILIREALIAILAVVYMLKVKAEVQVTQIGKWGAFLIFLYLPGLTLAHILDIKAFSYFVNMLGILGVILSSISFIQYVVINKNKIAKNN